jgi:predicted RNA methylase
MTVSWLGAGTGRLALAATYVQEMPRMVCGPNFYAEGDNLVR